MHNFQSIRKKKKKLIFLLLIITSLLMLVLTNTNLRELGKNRKILKRTLIFYHSEIVAKSKIAYKLYFIYKECFFFEKGKSKTFNSYTNICTICCKERTICIISCLKQIIYNKRWYIRCIFLLKKCFLFIKKPKKHTYK